MIFSVLNLPSTVSYISNTQSILFILHENITNSKNGLHAVSLRAKMIEHYSAFSEGFDLNSAFLFATAQVPNVTARFFHFLE